LSIVKKILLLLVLLFIDYNFISTIHVNKIEWSSFLPQSPEIKESITPINAHQQYLFCALDSEKIAQDFKKQHLIDKYIVLKNEKNTYLFIFDISKLNTVLEQTQEYPRSGTSVIGHILFENLFAELRLYAMVVLPFVLILLLLFIPLSLWLDLIIEMALYALLLGVILNFDFFEINSASLLALMFLVIYAITLINYIYAEGIDRKRVFFGIQISVVATMLSALFLASSDFSLIHSFGTMMVVGLLVLNFYINTRIYLMKFLPPLYYKQRFSFISYIKFFTIKKSVIVSVIITLSIILIQVIQPISIDLNIVNLMPESSVERQQINQFEEEHLPTLPFVITVQTENKNFSDEEVMQKLIALEHELGAVIPGKIIASAPMAFHEFVQLAPDEYNPNLFAQFLLASSFMEQPFDLWSPDKKESTIVASIPLSMATNEMRYMITNINKLGNRYPEFSVSVSGKISDFDYFISLFIKEFFTGLLVTLAATALFFWFYCRNMVSIITILFSALFSLGILGFFHLLFSKQITILTLLNVILYAGLITDSLIQLFVCYKREGQSCERSVLEPIFISNISILICLFGMFFVGGMMGVFAFDLAILLGANVIFILWIAPAIHRRYVTACND
jgi:hypothetical protein